MKLTEIAIDGYKGTQNTLLQNLGSGLNVVFSTRATTRRSIADFIPEILYGPDQFSRPTTMWANGYLQVESGGQRYRLSRPRAQGDGRLAVSDIHDSQIAHRTPDVLAHLEQTAFGNFFCVPLGDTSWNWSHIVEKLVANFDVTHKSLENMPFMADRNSHLTWKRTAETRITRLNSVLREMEALNNERARLLSEQGHHSDEYRNRLHAIEHELAEVQSQFQSLTASLRLERDRLTEIDRQVDELTRFIEQESSNIQHVPVARPTTNYLALFYERLDEVDNQIRRWRMVQSDIQGQRLRLRDEMVTHGELSIESHEHPYHDAREILLALESRINRTEEIARTWEQSPTPVDNSLRMTTLCNEMRNDLQALCGELGRQYKHVRHKATVAELKQLRRCYHEMDENVKRLLVRRESIMDEIRRLDPAGAEAIMRGDQQFTLCAEQEGFLVARQRFVMGTPTPEPHSATEYRTVYPDLAAERARLAELHVERSGLNDRLTTVENQLRSIESRRQSLMDERHRLSGQLTQEHVARIRVIDAELQPLESERINLQVQIEADRPWLTWQPNYLLGDAGRYLSQLSNQSLTDLAIDRNHHVNVKTGHGITVPATTLAMHEQSLIRLSLSLAAVEQLALRGIRLPMLIEDSDLIVETNSLVPVLESFCRNGHQLVLLTANRSRLEHSRQFEGTIFELPDTNITSPGWYPETPQLPRQDFPLPPAPPTASIWDHYDREPVPFNPISATPAVTRGWLTSSKVSTTSPDSFIPTPLVTAPRSACTRETMLQDIDLVESIYLTPMESLGIRTVGQLLDMDLEKQEIDLSRRGFNIDQIDRWQAQAWLLICLPEVSTSDARVLVGSGIDKPELVLQMDEADILDRIRRYLDSSAGRRSNATYSQFSTARLRGWSDRLRNDNGWRTYTRSRDRVQPASSRRETTANDADRLGDRRASSRRSLRRPAPPQTIRPDSPQANTRATSRVANRKGKSKSNSRYQFYLNTSDQLEAAPSIGPRTAERFSDLGIYTVQEFLEADAVDMAAQLENRRMSAKVLKTWQNQSRLMCAIPNLRGHDVQILVSCDILDPAELAAMDAEELLNIVLPFTNSKEGARVLRNARKPDLEEVTEWIDAANHLRSLKAA